MVRQFLLKLRMDLPFDSAVALYIYPEKWKFIFIQKLDMNVHKSFIGNSQIVDPIQMSFSGDCLNKLWYIQTMEFYSVIKRNKLMIHTTTWIKPKEIKLRIKS